MENELLNFIERIETINEEIHTLLSSKKDIISEAKAAGFKVKGINYIIKQRAKDVDERAEEKSLYRDYERIVGL